ncbi:MAG: AsmA family protein, partial [Myxococcota bacterium]
MARTGDDEQRPPRRRWARARRSVGAVAIVLVALIGLLFLGAGHLELWPFRGMVTDLVRDEAGLDVSFESLGLSVFSGHLEGRDVRVHNPARFAEGAPDFVRVARLDAELDIAALLGGNVLLSGVRLSDVEVTLAADEEGDALDALFPTDPDAPVEPVAPLSATLTDLDALGVDVADLALEEGTVRLLTLEDGAVVNRVELRGLALAGHFDALGVAEAALESTAPLTLAMESEGEAPLTLRFDPRLDATLAEHAHRVAVNAEAGADAAAGLPPGVSHPEGPVLSGVVEAAFDPEAGETRLRVQGLRALGEVLALDLSGRVRDEAPETLEDAEAHATLAVADAATLPFPLADLDARALDAELTLSEATVGAEGFAADATLRLKAAELALGAELLGGPEGLALENADLRATSALAGTADGEAFRTVDLDANATFDALRFAAAEPTPEALRVEVEGGELAYRAARLRLMPAPAPAADDAGDAPEETLRVALRRLDLDDGAGTRLAADEATLTHGGSPIVQALIDGSPLDGELALPVRHLEVAMAPRDLVVLDDARLALAMDGLALEGAGLFGLGGAADVKLTAGTLGGRLGGERLGGRALAPDLAMDFDAGTIRGEIPAGRVALGDTALEGSRLRVDLGDPLALDPMAPGSARAEVSGSLARLQLGDDGLALPRVRVALRKSGRGRLAIDAALAIADARAAGQELSGEREARLRGDVNLAALGADLELALSGAQGPDVELDVKVASEGRVLKHRIAGQGTRMGWLFAGPLAGLMPEGTTASLEGFTVESEGELAGVLASRAVPPRIAASPLDTAEGDARLVLGLTGLAAEQDGLAVASEALRLEASATAEGGPIHAELQLRSAQLEVSDGASRIAVRDLAERVVARGTGASLDDARASTTLRVAEVVQDLVPG